MDPMECIPDDSWFSSWTLPGCEEPDSIATSVIKGSVLEPWVEDVKHGVADSLKTMITFWVSIPDPNVGDVNGAQAEVISFLRNQLTWFGAVIMCFIIAFQCARMMWEQRGAPAKLVSQMIAIYFTVALISVPATAAGLLITGEIAARILEASTIGTSFSDNLFSLFNNEIGFTSSVLLLILLIAGMLIACLQCVLMIGRGGALFVILGILLAEAPASGTDSGKESVRITIGWIIALVVYKLVSAAIYGVGFRFLGTDTAASGNGLLQIFYGLTLLIMAVFSLPALLRVCAPSTSPVSDGRGPGSVVAGAAPGVAAATMGR